MKKSDKSWWQIVYVGLHGRTVLISWRLSIISSRAAASIVDINSADGVHYDRLENDVNK